MLAIIFAAYNIRAQDGDDVYKRALQLYHSGQYKAAEEAFTETISKNPSQPFAYMFRGNCYTSLHQ